MIMPPSPIVRHARADDLSALVHIKTQLAIHNALEATSGFLLGTDPSTYEKLIMTQRIWVLEDEGRVRGFAVTFSDDILRASDLWARQSMIVWRDFDPDILTNAKVGYFDQLAMEPTYQRRHLGAALALQAVDRLFAEGHAHTFATTVTKPFQNEAALPLLRRIGAQYVGQVSEVYPDVGPLVSDLHYIAQDTYKTCIDALRIEGLQWEKDVIDLILGKD
jgi:ribosomal protein S18 acetylase RimI-like enzyme